MRFSTVLRLEGKTATGIEVPDEIVAALGSGRRPKVVVTIGTYSYRSTVMPMGGRNLIPLAAEHRSAAGIAAGLQIEVDLVVDDAPRTVEVPDELAMAFAADSEAKAIFDALSFTHQKEWARWVSEAKRPETRARRVEQTVAGVREGRQTH